MEVRRGCRVNNAQAPAWRMTRVTRVAMVKASEVTRFICHVCRYSFATHSLENGYDIRTIQEHTGHEKVRLTMISTRVLDRGLPGVRSLMDGL